MSWDRIVGEEVISNMNNILIKAIIVVKVLTLDENILRGNYKDA